MNGVKTDRNSNPNESESRARMAVEAGRMAAEIFDGALDPDFPLRFGSDEWFNLVNSFLRESGYTEGWLLERFELESLEFLLYAHGPQREEFRRRYQGPGITPFVARLLMGGLAVSTDELDEHVPTRVQEALHGLGLLTPIRDDPSRLVCPALVYPALDFFVAADRGISVEGMGGYHGLDYVMSGTEQICRAYIDSLPATPCGTFLEIGTGSGLASLCASRSAGHVWATDITSRAVAYAEFNRRLNLVSNMTVLQGDLFAPVERLQFDRIASNPPFEPPLKRGYVFSVGGEDGEQIMARVLAAAPTHLNRGGRLYMQVMGTNREGDDFDARIRRYLGKAAAECDLALFVRERMAPSEYAVHQILGENDESWKLLEWRRFYEQLRALEVLHGHLVVQRAAESRPVFHTLRDFGPGASSAHMEWLLEWETRRSCPEKREFLNGTRPAIAPGTRVEVQYAIDAGELMPESYTFRIKAPFEIELTVQPWVVAMISACDGKRTAAELSAILRANGELAGEDGAADFTRALQALVACNVLRLDGFEPPCQD